MEKIFEIRIDMITVQVAGSPSWMSIGFFHLGVSIYYLRRTLIAYILSYRFDFPFNIIASINITGHHYRSNVLFW